MIRFSWQRLSPQRSSYVRRLDRVTSLVSFPIVMKLVIRLSQLMLPAAPARSSSSDLQPEASTSSNFHLHTLNLQCSLNPPEQVLRYWRTPDRPNPEYEAFSTFRDDLRTAVAPFAPLALMPSTPRMLRFPQGTASRQADTIELFLTNSLRGVLAVRVIDGRLLQPCPGPLTEHAADVFAALVAAGSEL